MLFPKIPLTQIDLVKCTDIHPLSKAERLHVGCKITVGQGADSDRTKATSDCGYLHHQPTAQKIWPVISLSKAFRVWHHKDPTEVSTSVPSVLCVFGVFILSVEVWTRSSFPELSQKSKPTKTEMPTGDNENLTSWWKWKSYLTTALVIPWN